MSRIGEALNKAAQEKAARVSKAAFPAQVSAEMRDPFVKEGLRAVDRVASAADGSGIDPSVVAYHDPGSGVAEQYRSLRTNILLNNLSKPLKTLAVCSSLEGEGKTTTAVNLAITMTGDSERSVLLVDCDLRAGTVHELLAVKSSAGLSDILVKGVELESVLYQTGIPNLTVLPRGEIPRNPSELLSSRKMRSVLDELKSKFDYVILDSPPIMPLTDACVISSQADGVIFIVQAHRTPRRVVKQAKNMLEHVHAKMLGFILTQAETKELTSRYGYYGYGKTQKNNSDILQQTKEGLNEI